MEKNFIPGTNEPVKETGEDLVKEANSILSNGKAEDHKAKKAEKKKRKQDTELIIREVSIDLEENIYINAQKVATIEADEDEGEEESTHKKLVYKIDSPLKPHKDLTNAFRKLTKYALELVEIEDENTEDYCVTKVKINGDMLMKKSRAEFEIGKVVHRTGKVVKIKTGEAVMYGESDYHNADKMAVDVEAFEKECQLYIGGKYREDMGVQMPLL